MADNKKGFLLYADYNEIFKKLTDEEAGKLAKHLFAYVSDENPVIDNRLLEIVFEPIKMQLKRDLKNWENTKDKKSESGVLGNLKRWNPDLYRKVSKGKMTVEDAVIEANNRKVSQCDDSDKNNRNAITGIANVAVNVNDNVTVNDTVTDINRAKAPVAAEAATAKPAKKDYEKIFEENKNKTVKEVVESLKDFLSKKPEFLEPYRDYWNIAVQSTNLPQVKVVGESRNKKLKARLKENGFDFVEIIRCVHKSSRLKNESSWFSFDWIFENDTNYAKIINGNYNY